MSSSTLCPSCNTEVTIGDKFCRACGTKLSWSVASLETVSNDSAPSTPTDTNEQSVTCKLCGNHNPPGSAYCESCGNVVGTPEQIRRAEKKSASKTGKSSSTTPPVKILQSWKLTAVIGVIFIIAIIVFQSNKTPVTAPMTPTTSGAPMQQGEMPLPDTILARLHAMENDVANNPNDLSALLRLANAYQDTRQFGLAVNAYQKYIQLDSTNADAHVDLGVTYFELARTDSVKHHEYLEMADEQMLAGLRANPNHQLACFNLGIVHLQKGEMDSAKEWFVKCAKIDSTTETGRRATMLIQQHTFTNPSS